MRHHRAHNPKLVSCAVGLGIVLTPALLLASPAPAGAAVAATSTTCYFRLTSTSATNPPPVTNPNNFRVARVLVPATKVTDGEYAIAAAYRTGLSSGTTTNTAVARAWRDISIPASWSSADSVRMYFAPTYAGKMHLDSSGAPLGSSSTASGSVVVRGYVYDATLLRTITSVNAVSSSHSATDAVDRDYTYSSSASTSVAGPLPLGRKLRLQVDTIVTASVTSVIGGGGRAQVDFGGAAIDVPTAYPSGRVRPYVSTVRAVFTTYGHGVTCPSR